MSRLFRYLLSLLLVIAAQLSTHAQRYPVTASTQIVPPYSVYLPDYAVPGSDKLRVILVQNDLTQPSYDVRLQMTVEQNGVLIMRTAAQFNPKPLRLSPGIPTIIGGSELTDYLNSANIEFSGGFSREQYERTRSLPEGAYRITFTAFDYRRSKVQVSNAGANIFFFRKSEPPLLNLPICGSRVEKRDPQFVTFSWSNRNTPDPLGGVTDYVFSLYEIKPAGSNPDYIVRSVRPIFTTTTQNSTIVYGPGEPQLTDSMQYVWTVQAKDRDGRDMFSNQGLSKSCTFTYLGNNPFAQNGIPKPALAGASTGQRNIRLSWPLADAVYKVEGYRLQYRAAAKDNVEFDWATVEIPNDSVYVLNSLEPAQKYEARLQWKITGFYGPYSEKVTITTDSAKKFTCSDGGEAPQFSNTKPAPTLFITNIVRIGNYEVLLTDVKGSNGTFSGKGRVVTLGLGLGMLVEFKNITVNTDLVVIRGEMSAVTDGIDKFIETKLEEQHGGNDVGKTVTGELGVNFTTRLHIFSAKDIKVDLDNGSITLTDSQSGATETISYASQGKKLPVVIEDVSGNLYKVTPDGKVTAIGQRDSSIGSAEALNKLQLDKGKVVFSVYDDARYAFDRWKDNYAQIPVLAERYEALADGKYHVSAKAIVPVEEDKVIATLEGAATDIDPDKVKFVSGAGIVFPRERNGNTYTITLTGGPESDAQEIFAVYPKEDKSYISMGKLLVASYKAIAKRVVLIPVGKSAPSPEGTLKDAVSKLLDDTYGKIGMQFEVEVDESFRYNKSWDKNGDSLLQDSKSAFLSNEFTGEEKALKKAYTKEHKTNDESIYFFLIHEAAAKDADLSGKMPRESQFGFIFTDGASDKLIARTVAHETGHGAYTLEHTFSTNIGLPKGQTMNLMDYSEGTELIKYQWDVVHDPGHVWGAFEDDEASENAHLKRFDSVFLNLDHRSISFLTPGGTVVSLPFGQLTDVSFQYGSALNSGTTKVFDPAKPTGVVDAFTLMKDDRSLVTYTFVDSKGSYFTASGDHYIQFFDKDSVDGFVFPMPCERDYNLYKFPVYGEDHYQNNQQEKPLTFIEMAERMDLFRSYTRPLAGIGKTYPITTYVSTKCPSCITDVTVAMTDGYCATPELIWIDKIAQLRNVYPEYFDRFTVGFADRDNKKPEFWIMPRRALDDPGYVYVNSRQFEWDLFLKKEENKKLVDQYPVDKVPLLKAFYEEFIRFIAREDKDAGDFWETFSEQTDVQVLSGHVIGVKETQFHLKQVDKDKKITAMKMLFGRNLPVVYDEAFVKLLCSFNPPEYPEVIALVDSFGIDTIYNRLYNVVPGEKANLTDALMMISNMLTATGQSKINEEDQLYLESHRNEVPSIEADMLQFENANWHFLGPHSLWLEGYGSSISYKQMVTVKIAGSMGIGGMDFRKGTTIEVPAIQAILMSHVAHMDVAGKTSSLALDVGMTLMGIGEAKILFTGSNYLRQAIVAADLVSSTVGIGEQLLNTDAITPGVRTQLQLISSVLSWPGTLANFKYVDDVVTHLDESLNTIIEGRNAADAMEEMNAIINVSDKVAKRGGRPTITDDAKQIIDRAVTLDGADDVQHAMAWLNSLEETSDYIYLVAHSAGNGFKVIHNGKSIDLNHRSMASWIRSRHFPESKQLVLLSCSNIQTAQDLSRNLKRSIIANDGGVIVYKNGVIEVENGLKHVDANGNVKDYEGKIGKQQASPDIDGFVILGANKLKADQLRMAQALAKDFELSGELARSLGANKAFMEAYEKETDLIKYFRTIPGEAEGAAVLNDVSYTSQKQAFMAQIANDPAFFETIQKGISDAKALVPDPGNLSGVDIEEIAKIQTPMADAFAAKDLDKSFLMSGMLNTLVFNTQTLTDAAIGRIAAIRKMYGIKLNKNVIAADLEVVDVKTGKEGVKYGGAYSGYEEVSKTPVVSRQEDLLPPPKALMSKNECRLGQFDYAKGGKGDFIPKENDSESKFFEMLWTMIKDKQLDVKKITVYTERPMCLSCRRVITKFSEEFDVKIEVFEGKFDGKWREVPK